MLAVENFSNLKTIEEIKEHFSFCAIDYFPNSTEYEGKKRILYIQANEKFYEVTINASILHSMDRDDNELYSFDRDEVATVDVVEVILTPVEITNYAFRNLSEEARNEIENLLKSKNIGFELKNNIFHEMNV